MNWTLDWQGLDDWDWTVYGLVLVMSLNLGFGSLLSHSTKTYVDPLPESSLTASYVTSGAIYTPPPTGMPGRREGAGTR
jgi:hypothetical protein